MLLFACLLALSGPARAGDTSFRQAAELEMGLDYDLDAVRASLKAPAPAAAPQNAPYATPSLPKSALPLEPNSAVDTVTVFPDRALVTRSRLLKVEAGTVQVNFDGLPLTLDPSQLNARLVEGAALVTAVERVAGQADPARIEALRAEARGRAETLGEVRDRIEALLAQRTYLRAALLHGGESQPVSPVPQIRGTLDYVGEAERALAAALRVEEDRARELDEQLRPLLTKIQDPMATGQTVRVELEVDRAGPVTVALRYAVIGAGWTPAYNVRLDPKGDQVELEYYGIVSQSTGERWTDAALVLSTANPSVSAVLPSLSPWVLGRENDGWSWDVNGALGAETSAASSTTRATTSFDQAPVPAFSTAVRSGGAVAFAIPGRRTIEGDGSAQRLPVGAQRFPVSLSWSAVPKQVLGVFRQGAVRYAGDAPLLPGVVSTYVGGDYVGATSIPAIPPGDELPLSFGTDDRFKVERLLVSRSQDYQGPLRKTVRTTFAFRIKVSNFGDAPRTVKVTDQIPVSESDRVVVKLLDTTPPDAASPEDPPGLLNWTLQIPAHAEGVIDLRFSVTGPIEEARGQMRNLEYMY